MEEANVYADFPAGILEGFSNMQELFLFLRLKSAEADAQFSRIFKTAVDQGFFCAIRWSTIK
jgi:hypothetical protein